MTTILDNDHIINPTSLDIKRTLFNKVAITGATHSGEYFVASVRAADEFEFCIDHDNIFTKEAYEAEKYQKPRTYTQRAHMDLASWYAQQPVPDFENLPAVLSDITYDDDHLKNINRLTVDCLVNNFDTVRYDIDLVKNQLLDTYEELDQEQLQFLMLDGADMKALEIEKRIRLQIEQELTDFIKANPYDLSLFSDERHFVYENSLSIDRNRYNEIQISGRTLNGDDVIADFDSDGHLKLKYELLRAHDNIFNFESVEDYGDWFYYKYYTQKALADVAEWYAKQPVVESGTDINLSNWRYRFEESGNDILLKITAQVNGCEEVSFEVDIDTNTIKDTKYLEKHDYIELLLDSDSCANYKIAVDKKILKQVMAYINENPHSLTYK